VLLSLRCRFIPRFTIFTTVLDCSLVFQDRPVPSIEVALISRRYRATPWIAKSPAYQRAGDASQRVSACWPQKMVFRGGDFFEPKSARRNGIEDRATRRSDAQSCTPATSVRCVPSSYRSRASAQRVAAAIGGEALMAHKRAVSGLARGSIRTPDLTCHWHA